MDFIIGFGAAVLLLLVASAFSTEAEETITYILERAREIVRCVGGCVGVKGR